MLRRAAAAIAGGGAQQWRLVSRRQSSSAAVSSAVNSVLLRSLKDHFLEIRKMVPPPKVNPPNEFTIIKGALDASGPVLKKTYKNEEISVSVMRLANIISSEDDDNDDGGINQLFVHVDVSKPGQADSLQFLCGLYPDALGIHSVAMRPKSEEGFVIVPHKFTGPLFEDLDENTRDAFHSYIEERGINEGLFPFLQAWLYVKDHRNLARWFTSLASFIQGEKGAKIAAETKPASGASSLNAAEGA